MTVVLDASAVVELLLRTPTGLLVARHLDDVAVMAPDLLDVEVCSALARLERSGVITPTDAGDAVLRLGRLPVPRIACELLRDRAWALRDRVRVADAFYVATAALLRGSLLTCDARLARAPLPSIAVTLIRGI